MAAKIASAATLGKLLSCTRISPRTSPISRAVSRPYRSNFHSSLLILTDAPASALKLLHTETSDHLRPELLHRHFVWSDLVSVIGKVKIHFDGYRDLAIRI